MALPPPPSAPKRVKDIIKIRQIPEYVYEKYDLDISRMTAHNWATVGAFGHILQTMDGAGPLRVKKEWVDEFISTLPRR